VEAVAWLLKFDLVFHFGNGSKRARSTFVVRGYCPANRNAPAPGRRRESVREGCSVARRRGHKVAASGPMSALRSRKVALGWERPPASRDPRGSGQRVTPLSQSMSVALAAVTTCGVSTLPPLSPSAFEFTAPATRAAALCKSVGISPTLSREDRFPLDQLESPADPIPQSSGERAFYLGRRIRSRNNSLGSSRS